MAQKPAQTTLDAQLKDVLNRLSALGVTLRVSTDGTILAEGYTESPDQASVLVANRELLNCYLPSFLAATVKATVSSTVSAGLDASVKAAGMAAGVRERPAAGPSLAPETIAQQRAARRAVLRAALAASRERLPDPPMELPTSGRGCLTVGAWEPASRVAALARQDRQDRAAGAGRHVVPILQERRSAEAVRYAETPP
jgi:hypothetical protein